MEMPPPNEVSVVFFRSPREYDYVDFCVRAITKSRCTHCALRIDKWVLHLGHGFPSQWVLHDVMSERWKPVAEIKIGDYVTHALTPQLKQYEGRILSRFKTWLWGWFTLASKPVIIRVPEPTTCVSLVRDICREQFGLELSAVEPGALYQELKEIFNV